MFVREMQFQSIFENAAATTTTAASGTQAKTDSDKLDYSVSQGIKQLQSSLIMQEKLKEKTSKRPVKKKTDANTTIEEAQDDPLLFGKREKLVHKKWTSLDKRLQWELITAFIDQDPTGKYNKEHILSLLKQGNIKPECVEYNHKEAKITALDVAT